MPFSKLFGRESKDPSKTGTSTNQKEHDVPKSSLRSSLATHLPIHKQAREPESSSFIDSKAVVSPPPTARPDTDNEAVKLTQRDAALIVRNTHGAFSTSEDTGKSPGQSGTHDPPSARPDSGIKGPPPSKVPDLSQRIWNDAYDEIEAENGDLVKSYALALKAFLGDETPNDTPALDTDHFLAQFNDRTQRQEYLEKLVAKGKTKVATTVKVSNVVGNIADALLRTKPAVDLALTIPQAAPAALPWAGVCLALQILSNPKSALNANLAGVAYVASRMEWYCAVVEHLLHTTNISSPSMSFESVLEKLQQKVVQLYKAILLYQMSSVCSYYRNQGWNFFLQLWNFDDWEGALDCVEQAQKSLLDDWDTYDRAKAGRVRDELLSLTNLMESHLDDIRQTLRDHFSQENNRLRDREVHEILSALFVVNPLDDMTRMVNEKEPLIDDVHKWILQDEKYEALTNWTDSSTSQCRLLWIKGDAGTGKTMLLISIIRQLSNQLAKFTPSLACFFFQSQGKTRKTLDKSSDALRSLAWMLLTSQPDLVVHLQGDYQLSKDKLFTDANAAEAMLRNLEQMLKHAQPVYFVVDALDECDHDFDRILDLITTSLSISTKIRWLISSRPEVNLLTRLDDLQKDKLKITDLSLQLDMASRKDRVERYIQYKLSTLQSSKKVGKSYQDDKIMTEISREVTHRAQDNLLWLSLVFHDLLQMRGSYAVKSIKKYPSGLPQLYDHKMSILEREEREYLNHCQDVLVTVSHTHRALSLTELTALVPWSDDTDPSMIVEKCRSFITETGETILVNHKSAKDYLVGIMSRLRGGAIQGHAEIATLSIEAMKLRLKRNIYGLRYASNPVDILPPDPDPLASVAYSCEFWMDHLRLAIEQRKEDLHVQQVLCVQGFHFLTEHFLHWLESLSLLQKHSNGIISVRKILQVIQLSDKNHEIAGFLKEAVRFATTYASIIERAPMQIYGAALIFCPAKSQLKELFWQRERPDFIRSIKGIDNHWDLCLQILEGHGDRVMSLVYSNDGRRLATGSSDGSLRIWNVETGTSEPLEGHTEAVFFVAFFSDDKKLISGSFSGDVRILNIETGASRTLLSSVDSLEAMDVSPDGSMVALGSDDDCVVLLDVETGRTKSRIKLHTGVVMSIAFSSDSTALAFGDGPNQVQLWDVETGALRLLEGYTDSDLLPAFSPDGNTLALMSLNNTVQLWDVCTGSTKRTLETNSKRVRAITFSGDGTTLAFGDWKHQVRLWNIETGAVKPLSGHTDSVRSIAFSSDSTMVLSGSRDNTIRLWHVGKGTSQVLKGHTSSVESVVLSPDGTTFASAAVPESTVRLWSIEDSDVEPPECHDSSVDMILFSADGTILVSASRHDGTVRLWDTKAGTSQVLKGFQSDFDSLALSPDGKSLAVAGGEHLQIWNFETGAYQLLDDSLRVWSLAYSPDGKTLASADANEIRLWNVRAGTFQVLAGVSLVAFSPDGQRLASKSENGIRLWNVETGSFQLLHDSPSSGATQIVFSTDGKTLAASFYEKGAVRLWSTETNKPLRTLEGICYHSMYSVSSDMSCIYTDKGVFPVDSPSSAFPVLLDQERWICRGSEPVLWLPPEYVATSVAVFEDVVALGHESGKVTILEFYPEAEAKVQE